jgi:tetratricopeptide (TPR) repeat protein
VRGLPPRYSELQEIFLGIDKMAAKQVAKAPPVAPVQASDENDPIDGLVDWYQKNRMIVISATTLLAVVVIGFWFTTTAATRKEAFGQRALQGARASVSAQNLPLAENDLSRVVSDYAGTNAASEAAVLLGHVRLLQDQDALAVTGLRDFVNSGPEDHFLEPALSLLAGALEEVGQMAEASAAYSRAAEGVDHDFRKAELLNNAARTLGLSGDRDGALEIYRSVFNDLPDAPGAIEARVRAGELGYVAPN